MPKRRSAYSRQSPDSAQINFRLYRSTKDVVDRVARMAYPLGKSFNAAWLHDVVMAELHRLQNNPEFLAKYQSWWGEPFKFEGSRPAKEVPVIAHRTRAGLPYWYSVTYAQVKDAFEARQRGARLDDCLAALYRPHARAVLTRAMLVNIWRDMGLSAQTAKVLQRRAKRAVAQQATRWKLTKEEIRNAAVLASAALDLNLMEYVDRAHGPKAGSPLAGLAVSGEDARKPVVIEPLPEDFKPHIPGDPPAEPDDENLDIDGEPL